MATEDVKKNSRINAMTLDVEDYFHVSAFDNIISPSDWDSIDQRVERNTHKLLDLFAEHSVKSTFFTLGWVAKKCPNLIKRIVDEGHELASHGTNHRRNTELSKEQVFEDIRVSKDLLEQASGEALLGYRAPSFSINTTNEYVFDILVELGFKYSSSTYPISHDLYGVPEWPRFVHRRKEGITEIPVSTLKIKDKNKGIGGGGYFRLYPYWISRRRVERYLNSNPHPYNFYFHPWEIDANQPRVENAPLKSKLRHYINLDVMERKLVQLMKDYNWSCMKEVYKDAINAD